MEKEIGEREGKFYAINVPLKDGIDDASFTRLFKTVSSARITMFQINVFICCMRCQARTFYLYFFHFQFCRLFPRFLKHIYQVPLFYNVEQIRLLEIAWAASISPLMVHSNSFIILFSAGFATIKTYLPLLIRQICGETMNAVVRRAASSDLGGETRVY